MKNFSIGLDIGTTSIGWAVVSDENYKVMKKGNHKLWGVETFEEAIQAKDRRVSRSIRRRYGRRKERINLLQEIFSGEINKVDPHFYEKLEESKLEPVDKKNIILNCEKKELKDYYKKYPTIYHLRKHLMESVDREDIRLVYLALHHIIKYRGNFNYDASFKVNNIDFINLLKEVFNYCLLYNNFLDISDNLADIDFNAIDAALLDKTKNDQKLVLKNELSKIMNKNVLNEFIKAIIGDTFNAAKMFDLDCEKEIKMSFDGKNYEEKLSDLEKLLVSEEFDGLIEFIESLKGVYDAIFLKKLFRNSSISSLSGLMVWKYEKHKNDLEILKNVLKSNKKIYDEVFSFDDVSLYRKYVSSDISYEDFKKDIVKKLDKVISNDVIKDFIKSELEEGNFLPRITTVNNGVFPYQLNREELKKIIENQGKFYPFLLKEWKNGITLIERLLEFRIPYYVGPLNSTSQFSWLIKKTDEKINPFNFEDIVDLSESAEKFITRMISNCSYLYNAEEKVMPSNSIYYSKYKVLNELKQIKIGKEGNERKLSVDAINQIYKELFLKTKGTITDKKFKNYLLSSPSFSMYYNESINITGYSTLNAFANNMSSYIDFFGENGLFINTNLSIDDAEEIIKYVTIFEDKNILRKKIREKFGLSDDLINKISNLKYKGWGNLSKKLLMGLNSANKNTGEVNTILELLEKTDMNFQQILHDKDYNFQEIIKEENNENSACKVNYNFVKNLYTSPATKRAIYQSLKIIDELVTYLGENPTHIFIEMARENGDKKRTDNRKKQLEKLFEKHKNNIYNYQELSNELNKLDNKDISKKVFLYFIQNGKSLYSPHGKSLDLDLILAKKDNYEIDHIVPRTLIPDDSLDNLALVFRDENQNKSSSFVLPEEYRTPENIRYWKHLNEIGLISTKKYNNLCRKTYSEEAINGFINRQLVETRQICVNVASIIESYLNSNSNKIKTKIEYLKAGISSGYRDKYDLFKFRGLNDYHHAHDAYLAAALGLYKITYFKFPEDYSSIQKINKELYTSGKFNEARYGYFLNSLDRDCISHYNIDKSFELELFNSTINKTLHQNDINVTRKPYIKNDGQLFKVQICSPKSSNNLVPIKKDLDIKYGGYGSLLKGYFVLVKYKKGVKFIGIPLYYSKENEKDEYIRKELNLKDNENYIIKKDKIPFDTKILWNNQYFYIKGYSSGLELANATQISLDVKAYNDYKYLLNYIFNNKLINDLEKEKIDDLSNYLFEKSKSYFPIYLNKFIKLKEKYDLMDNFNDKCLFLKELFKMTSTSKASANFQNFGLADRMERLSGQNPKNNCLIIYESPAGLHKIFYNIED